MIRILGFLASHRSDAHPVGERKNKRSLPCRESEPGERRFQ
jgi:hypothetical protein